MDVKFVLNKGRSSTSRAGWVTSTGNAFTLCRGPYNVLSECQLLGKRHWEKIPKSKSTFPNFVEIGLVKSGHAEHKSESESAHFWLQFHWWIWCLCLIHLLWSFLCSEGDSQSEEWECQLSLDLEIPTWNFGLWLWTKSKFGSLFETWCLTFCGSSHISYSKNMNLLSVLLMSRP